MIRKATRKDLDAIDQLAERAILQMMEDKIPQWDLSYPRKEHFSQDIKDEILYVYKDGKEIQGVMAMRQENDPPYQAIRGWYAGHGESMVLHRCIVDPKHQGNGVFRRMMFYAIDEATRLGYLSIKIDTHEANYKMRQFLNSCGFVHIGYLESINREAYELVLEE